jgi:hypothetical protein
MELIIAMILFVALVACWIVLPGDAAPVHAHADAEATPSAAAQHTV